MIVRKDHEKAVKFLKEKKNIISDPAASDSQLKGESVDDLSGNQQLVSESSSTRASSNSQKSPGTVQKSLASFFVADEKPQPTPMEKMQSDIDRILVMLDSLTVNEKSQSQANEVGVNSDVTTLISASNLLEIKHPDIHVEVIEDGCRVTCLPCKNVILSQPSRRM